jgi:hypothetical protein
MATKAHIAGLGLFNQKSARALAPRGLHGDCTFLVKQAQPSHRTDWACLGSQGAKSLVCSARS